MSQSAPSQAPPLARALDAARAVLLSPFGITAVSLLTLIVADLRRYAEVDPGYGFLRWNLFLAWVPLVLAYAVSWAARRKLARPALPLLALAWIVFLPNAPYLVTDLVHLREGFNFPNLIALSLLALRRAADRRQVGAARAARRRQPLGRDGGLARGPDRHGADRARRVPGPGAALEQLDDRPAAQRARARPARRPAAAGPGRLALGAAGMVVFAGSFYLSYRILTGARSGAPRLAPGALER